MAYKFYVSILAVIQSVSPDFILSNFSFVDLTSLGRNLSTYLRTEAPREISFLCVVRSPPVENSIFDCARHLYYFKRPSLHLRRKLAHILRLEKNMLSYEMNIARESNLIYFKSLINFIWFHNVYHWCSQKLYFNKLIPLSQFSFL